jgi:putative NIF3 family GTP cyclohydrolase 1 type 2
LHQEREVRIETILPSYLKTPVTRALLSVHPYEEPAYDFYSLENTWKQAGSGIVGELLSEEDELLFLQRVKEILKTDCIQHSPLTGRKVREIAICGGSGAFMLSEAIAYGADVFLTGEVKYNDFYDVEDKILLAVAGHYETEVCTKDIFFDVISEKFPTFAVQISSTNSNPVKYI